MKKKIITSFLVICIAVLPLYLSGCGKKDTATVNIAVEDTAQANIFERAAEIYENETGNKLNLKNVSSETEEKLTALGDKAEPPAIFQIGSIDEYEKLKDYCTDLKKSKVFSYLYNENLALKGDKGKEVYALPYDVTGYGIIYNDKIVGKYFEDENENNRYSNMSDITDFKALKQLAEDLSKQKDKLNVNSVFASPSLKSGDDWEWHSGILNLPLYFEFSENDDYGNSDEAFYNSREIDLRYDNEYKQTLDLISGNSTDRSTWQNVSKENAIKEFATGKAAMILGSDKLWSRISAMEGSTLDKDSVKFLPLYIDTSGDKNQGITVKREKYFAVNKSADKRSREAALDFLDWLFSSESGKKIVTDDLGVLSPFNTFGDSDLSDDPLKRETARYLKDSSVKNVLWVLSEPIRDITKSDTATAIGNYLNGSKSFDETKTVIKDKFKKDNR